MSHRILATVHVGATAAVLLAAAALPAAAQTRWEWAGRLAAGQTLEVVGVAGIIRASPADGAGASVSALKSSQFDDPDVVEIVAVEHAAGVTICALYPSRRGRPANECRPGGGGQSSVDDVNVIVEFEVHVPADVNLRATNVTGGVHATGLAGNVQGASVSGDVVIVTSGIARATTVSGDVDVTMGSLGERDLSFTTVSGDVTVRVSGQLDADIRFSTVSGRIESDFPITMVSGGGRGGFRGTIGEGGRTLRFTTVSGDIALRRR